MDIKQLKFLVALDETRHFGQAAARCHVTQPTLSMRLRQLEDELGLELVRRGQRFEGFSAEGERILAWARSLLAAQDGLLAEAAACRGHLVGTLRLGVVPLASFDPMRLISLFAERHPGLRFQLHALSSDQILEGLVRNQLDLGLSYLDRLDREHFASLELAEARMGLLYDQRHFHFVSSQPALGTTGQLAPGPALHRHALSPVHRSQLPCARPQPASTPGGRCRAPPDSGGQRRSVLQRHAVTGRRCSDRRSSAPATHRGRSYPGTSGPDHAS